MSPEQIFWASILFYYQISGVELLKRLFIINIINTITLMFNYSKCIVPIPNFFLPHKPSPLTPMPYFSCIIFYHYSSSHNTKCSLVILISVLIHYTYLWNIIFGIENRKKIVFIRDICLINTYSRSFLLLHMPFPIAPYIYSIKLKVYPVQVLNIKTKV